MNPRDETPQMMQANVNQSGLYHGVRGHKRTEQCETLVPPCVESPAPPEPQAEAAARKASNKDAAQPQKDNLNVKSI